jgi:carbonic anhydrase/acetyltransferase-like protein (isoleucine patch superfamily)
MVLKDYEKIFRLKRTIGKMIEKNPNRDLPEIDKTAYIHPTAVVIGKVKIGRNVFIAPGAVIRADEPRSSIIIRDNCNVQDRVIIHTLENTSVLIEENTSLAHGCIIHGPCKIGERCFIGFGAVVFNATLSNEVIVKHLTVVEGVKILSGKLVPNGMIIDSESKVKDLEIATEELKIFSQKVARTNLDLVKGYKSV